MRIAKVYDSHEAKLLGFDADEDDEQEEKMTYEAWFDRYGNKEKDDE